MNSGTARAGKEFPRDTNTKKLDAWQLFCAELATLQLRHKIHGTLVMGFVNDEFRNTVVTTEFCTAQRCASLALLSDNINAALSK